MVWWTRQQQRLLSSSEIGWLEDRVFFHCFDWISNTEFSLAEQVDQVHSLNSPFNLGHEIFQASWDKVTDVATVGDSTVASLSTIVPFFPSVVTGLMML